MKKFYLVLAFLCLVPAAQATFTLGNGGKSAIVVADDAVISAKYAAKELAFYIEKALGTKLDILKESDAKQLENAIYVGNTAAARKIGLTQEKFPQEKFTIQEKNGSLYIVGGEDKAKLLYTPADCVNVKTALEALYANGIVRTTRRGTLYAAYRFISDFLGVRWLWPGELGTYIPGQKELTVKTDFKLDAAPGFKNRKWRSQSAFMTYFKVDKYHSWGKKKSANPIPQLTFTKETADKYAADLQKFLLINQEGDSQPLPAPASHVKWWNVHKKKNLDFFAMNDDGSRGFALSSTQTRGPRLCVSNPRLHDHIVSKWQGGEYIGLGEADYRGFCRCKTCMEWDKPQPPELKGYSTTNRYIKYAKAVRKLIKERKGVDVKVSILMYMDYLYPPYPAEKLDWLYGKFVPWGSGFPSYFPVTDSEFALLKRAWQGWSDSGVEMNYRPNYFLNGYVVPTVDIKQSLEFFHFAAARKMTGFDYDSLRGNWASKGPMLYGHLRLGMRPELSVDTVLNEYYSAFGPAAEDIRRYFEYFNEHTKTVPGGGIHHGNISQTAEFYPDKVFDDAVKFLDSAAEKVKDARQDYIDRVKFIRIGFDHARLCVKFNKLYLSNQFTAARKVLDEIIAFRQKYNSTCFVNLNVAGGSERKAYRGLANFIKGQFQYSEITPVNKKGFKRSDWVKASGLRPSKWGISLAKGSNSGVLIKEYSAGANNHFITAKLDLRAYARKVENSISVSFDGKDYTVVKKGFGQGIIDLSKYINGKSKFYIKAEFTRKPEFKEHIDVLLRFRLDYTKANPDAVPERKKLDIGTGWLDFTPVWYFKKDPKNLGLPKKDMNVKTFNPAKMTKVEVPARLEETAVGPYLSYGYYSAVFDVRNDWQGRDIDILVGAVDKEAWVYFNGHYVGEHTVKSENVGVGTLYKEPFIIRVPSKYINVGGKNLLQIKVYSGKGSSGIWKPVKIRPIETSELY